MLVELRIRNFAVIDDLSLRLDHGLNVLTGETGAGKSIIVGALSLLLGERASSETVRAGADVARVEGVFDLERRPQVEERMSELGLPLEDGLLILRREVQREGRNRAWVNGSPATAGAVGELGRALVDLHGQHEHQTLLRPGEQREILDAYANLTELAGRVASLHQRLTSLQREREEREGRRRELEERADFLRFQLSEIEGAEVREGEDAELEEEESRLSHAEELAGGARALHMELYGRDGAVSETVDGARRTLGSLARIDPSLGPVSESLEEAYHQIVEAARSLGDYAGRVEHDPARLEEIRRRLDLLGRLERKYGPGLDGVLERGRELRAEMDELDGASFELEGLGRRIGELEEELTELARELGAGRRDAGAGLAVELEGVLPALGMPGARFRVEFRELPEVGAGGAERVEFTASLNPGFEPRPLARIASGGELSRVMLALKAVLARVDPVPTLIFDEIDAGIGGEVATAVAAKLLEVAAGHQVFVITHLPQLASVGHRHLRVEKTAVEGLAVARVSALEGEDRVREVARMLGGDPESRASREHAQELLSGG